MKKITIILLLGLSMIGQSKELQKATFAGGCFWCMEPPFEKLLGVHSVVSGYAGGSKENANYQKVSSGQSKHLEVVQVTFDAEILSYERLLETFWMNIDPTDPGGQFVDRGTQYKTAVYYHNNDQKKIALDSVDALTKMKVFNGAIVTPVIEFLNFFAAEDYHQDFYKKNDASIKRYKSYRAGSGRDHFINKHWVGKDVRFFSSPKYKAKSDKELKKELSALQYQVTKEDGTERAFQNKYWDNKKEGIYVDVISGEPLFSSKDKFKSGSGWPSFTKPIDPRYMITRSDLKHGMVRTEVRSRFGNAHLGHIFNDGPRDKTGLRYCINSASLDFISKEDLEKKGYGEYKKLFN